MVSTDRGRGIFTESNREYLTGNKSGISRQAQQQQERDIKDRLRNAILDFRFVFEHMDPDSRAEVYEDLNIEGVDLMGEREDEGVEALLAMAAILYEAVLETGVPRNLVFSKGPSLLEEQRFLPEGSKRQIQVSADFDREIKEPEEGSLTQIDEVLKQLRFGRDIDDLNSGELKTLIRYANMSDGADFSPLLKAAEEERNQEREDVFEDSDPTDGDTD
ncbi:hypothetical protein NDI54_05810 [Haloarcula sp. S1AR25-5A]|uniref:Domain of unknown function domain-containing protein n=1 Tax=Haloarcula terrestris TaxID=2950533 RepID=A0AAE4EWS9_9EURY|nr:hypothetical protein [Haloarcula terrestris]MDS0220869.1 hypothetical protein [Haloarcula terrestris]